MNQNKPIHAKPSLYAYYFHGIKEIALKYGYNLVLHGSLATDLDLIAIPWQEEIKDHLPMIKEFAEVLGGEVIEETEEDRLRFAKKYHGRLWYGINLNRGEPFGGEDPKYYLDISIVPAINIQPAMMPTSFRFLNQEEAEKWHTNTNEWHLIDQIHFDDNRSVKMASTSFAWIDFAVSDVSNRFEFRYNNLKQAKTIIPQQIYEDYSKGQLKANLSDITAQVNKPIKPPAGEYWVKKGPDIILKTKDSNEADECASKNNAISIRPDGTFYTFSRTGVDIDNIKIFFVGMHNKPKMKPLDSKTKSGKIIDKIIKKLGLSLSSCIKTNLCEVEYFPSNKVDIYQQNLNWVDKYNPGPLSIIVLLGNWVHKNYLLTNGNIIKIGHPAGCLGHEKQEKYIQNALDKIKLSINKLPKL